MDSGGQLWIKPCPNCDLRQVIELLQASVSSCETRDWKTDNDNNSCSSSHFYHEGASRWQHTSNHPPPNNMCCEEALLNRPQLSSFLCYRLYRFLGRFHSFLFFSQLTCIELTLCTEHSFKHRVGKGKAAEAFVCVTDMPRHGSHQVLSPAWGCFCNLVFSVVRLHGPRTVSSNFFITQHLAECLALWGAQCNLFSSWMWLAGSHLPVLPNFPIQSIQRFATLGFQQLSKAFPWAITMVRRCLKKLWVGDGLGKPMRRWSL